MSSSSPIQVSSPNQDRVSRLDRIIAQLHRQTLSTGARVSRPGEDGPLISDLEAQIHALHAAVQELQASQAGSPVARLQAEVTRLAQHAQREREEATLAAQERWQRMEQRLASQELSLARLTGAMEEQARRHAEELAELESTMQARLSTVVGRIADQFDELGAGLDAAVSARGDAAAADVAAANRAAALAEALGPRVQALEAAVAGLGERLHAVDAGVEASVATLASALRAELAVATGDLRSVDVRGREEVGRLADGLADLRDALRGVEESAATQAGRTSALARDLADAKAAHSLAMSSLGAEWAGGLADVHAEAEALGAELLCAPPRVPAA
ncbi:hypothetical protein ACKKBG_A27240 [Auxenochlorella protothecoides x Auxenochlorella symbiontica]|uniref:HAMP domain-containing protein n=1 Tax=Auxenochlorella protothecoides TaxID=3075 RepID=A0A087SGU8_AUXPR|nr:hypothetical protein F751_1831 [Auxenochlorella protothecoides]KFM24952.1 hypothetical protein F751_1831 [Auxenochlorella protothecoides]